MHVHCEIVTTIQFMSASVTSHNYLSDHRYLRAPANTDPRLALTSVTRFHGPGRSQGQCLRISWDLTLGLGVPGKALSPSGLYGLTEAEPRRTEGWERNTGLLPSGSRRFPRCSSSGRQQAGGRTHPAAFGRRQDVSLPASWGKGTMAV